MGEYFAGPRYTLGVRNHEFEITDTEGGSSMSVYHAVEEGGVSTMTLSELALAFRGGLEMSRLTTDLRR